MIEGRKDKNTDKTIHHENGPVRGEVIWNGREKENSQAMDR